MNSENSKLAREALLLADAKELGVIDKHSARSPTTRKNVEKLQEKLGMNEEAFLKEIKDLVPKAQISL